MNKISLSYWIATVIISCCARQSFADLPTAKFTTAQAAYIESLRPRIEESIRTYMEPQAASDASAAEDASLTRLLLDNRSAVTVCAERVIQSLRKKYVSSPSGVGPVYLGSSSKVIADDAPFLLYIFKGSTAGLYEYTKLSGQRASVIDFVWRDNKTWDESQLLGYRLSTLGLDNYYRELFVQSHGISQVDPDYLEMLVKLSADYRDTSGQIRVEQFLLDFAFDRNSYVSALIHDSNLRQGAESGKYDALTQYFVALMRKPEQKVQFMTKARTTFGVAALESLLKSLLTDKNFKQSDPKFLQQCLRLAVEARLFDVAGEICSILPPVTKDAVVAEQERILREALNRTSQLHAKVAPKSE